MSRAASSCKEREKGREGRRGRVSVRNGGREGGKEGGREGGREGGNVPGVIFKAPVPNSRST
jgi:hypothetical protein